MKLYIYIFFLRCTFLQHNVWIQGLFNKPWYGTNVYSQYYHRQKIKINITYPKKNSQYDKIKSHYTHIMKQCHITNNQVIRPFLTLVFHWFVDRLDRDIAHRLLLVEKAGDSRSSWGQKGGISYCLQDTTRIWLLIIQKIYDEKYEEIHFQMRNLNLRENETWSW